MRKFCVYLFTGMGRRTFEPSKYNLYLRTIKHSDYKDVPPLVIVWDWETIILGGHHSIASGGGGGAGVFF